MRKEIQSAFDGDVSAYKSYIYLGDELIELPDERVKITILGEPLVVHPSDDDWYYREKFSNNWFGWVGRVVYCIRLESGRAERLRGFESYTHRSIHLHISLNASWTYEGLETRSGITISVIPLVWAIFSFSASRDWICVSLFSPYIGKKWTTPFHSIPAFREGIAMSISYPSSLSFTFLTRRKHEPADSKVH